LQSSAVAQRSNATVYEILLACLVVALAAQLKRTRIVIDLEGHGREPLAEQIDLSRTVGWFTSIFPITVELEGDDAAAGVKAVQDELRSLQYKGAEFGVLRHLSDEGGALAAERRDVVFNYLGHFDQFLSGSSLLRFAAESPGPWHGPACQRPYPLEIIARIQGGELVTAWSYDSAQLDATWVEALAGRFRDLVKGLPTSAGRTAARSPEPLGSRTPVDGGLETLSSKYEGVEGVYPLSPIQSLYASLDGSDRDIGLDQWYMDLAGELEQEALRSAWQDVVARHAALRTVFPSHSDGERYQVVLREPRIDWRVADRTAIAEEQRQAELERMLEADRAVGFDLEHGPLTRLTLVRWHNLHTLIWTHHHLQLDGWSWPLVLEEVGNRYDARCGASVSGLPVPVPYARYVEWINGLDQGASDAFWRAYFKNYDASATLPGAPAPSASASCAYRSLLSASQTEALAVLARRWGVTLSSLIQAAWGVVLSAPTQHDDVCFGATFSGRPAALEGVERIVGPFITNLPIRLRLPPAATLKSVACAAHARTVEVTDHQYASPERIQAVSGVPWSAPLFESLIVFQNYTVGSSRSRMGSTVAITRFVAPIETNLPLTLIVAPGPQLEIRLQAGKHEPRGFLVEPYLTDLQSVLQIMVVSEGEATIEQARSGLRSRAHAVSVPSGQPLQTEYVAPSTATQRAISAAWQDIFGVRRVGLKDNFFDLGGRSVMMPLIKRRLQQELVAAQTMPLVALFQNPTVESLAAYLDSGESSGLEGQDIRTRGQRARAALARRRRQPPRTTSNL
jgi:non-ribosomal peptide synthase protein (TIGR01720 family)